MQPTRRTTLRALGTAVGLGGLGSAAVSTGAAPPKKGTIRTLGHSLLSDPPGGFAEESVRADGRFAVVGSFLGPGGSFLVDIRDPTNPTEVHHVSSPSTSTRHADVKFDRRDGLYYRTLEGDELGVEVIDYGFDAGTPEDPEIVARIDAGPTHNVFAHPEESLLYAVNEHNGTSAMEIWDVESPDSPSLVTEVGPVGGLHDIVVDAERELAHAAFISDAFGDFDPARDFAGYLIYDVSTPTAPTEVGRFDYTDEPDYADVPVGEEAFANCHYANYDPNREITVVGDEIGFGNPGGKHVFDVGWGDGSPSDPQPVGFTLSPNAEPMDEPGEAFDWTGHNFDVVPKGKTTLLVSGDYHEGAVVYDISDPTDPTATDQFRTVEGADEANPPLFAVGAPPMAWGADYVARRDLTVVSDMVTGLYVLRFTPSAGSTD